MNDRALDRLFRRFRDRSDGAALAAVFDATARELFEVACHLIRDPVEAEDLVQSTFLAAIRRAEAYDGSSPLKGWLYGILWREAAKARRAAARSVDPHRLPERREPEPIESLVASELPAAVVEALAKLPERYREVLEPLIREGRKPEEIANSLRSSPGTVRSRIHRGMERLRRALPADLVPVSGLAAVPLRGLSKVRAEVLQAAGHSPAVAAAAPGIAFNATLGGLVLSKGALTGAAAVALAAVAWVAVGGRGEAEAAPAAAADPAHGDAGTEGASSALAATRPAPDRAPLETPDAARAGTAPTSPGIDAWLARFNEAPEDWRHGWDVAEEIAKLPPDEALAVMRGVWPHLTVPVKEQVLKPFVFRGGHPHALEVLDLAATDAALTVQARAFTYLKSYAFRDFANDYEAYLAWAVTYRDRPVREVLEENARSFVAELRSMQPAEVGARMRELGRLDLDAGTPAGIDLAGVMREAGALEALGQCFQGEDDEAKRQALDWSRTLRADESWLRTWALPAVQSPEGVSAKVLDASLAALGRPDCTWAREPILEHLRRESTRAPNEEDGGAGPVGTMAAARALAEIGDPAAIPTMIEILLHDRTGRLAYDVGYFGLAKMTGVTWNDGLDSAWWLAWWEKNRLRLPPDVQAIPIRR